MTNNKNEKVLGQFMILRDRSNAYIKDGNVVKNRGRLMNNINIEHEKSLFNNIIIEQDGSLDIYCDSKMNAIYLKDIKLLKNRFGMDIQDRITIHQQ